MNATKKKILVVEDDNDSRNALCAMLDALGFSYIGFGSGKEALEKIKGQKVDMALLDIMMPDVDGYQICSHIKSSPEHSGCKVIFLSAKSKESDIKYGLELGADAYMTKPFSTRNLMQKVEELL